MQMSSTMRCGFLVRSNRCTDKALCYLSRSSKKCFLSSSVRPSFSNAVVHATGDLPFGTRQYVLLPPHIMLHDVVDGDQSKLKIATLHAHRNIVFGAQVHVPDYRLTDIASGKTLLEAALRDCSAKGEQPQAVSTLHGLCDWVSRCLDGQDHSQVVARLMEDVKSDDGIALAAVRAIATGIPRPGHSVVGQGTHRDAASAWEELAREFVDKTVLSDECEFYKNFYYGETELVGIELLADTRPDYLKSAGGAMARFFFL